MEDVTVDLSHKHGELSVEHEQPCNVPQPSKAFHIKNKKMWYGCQ